MADRGYSYTPLTELKKKERGLYTRKESWFDRVIQYIFFFVLGAFAACMYGKYRGLF